MCVVLVCFFFLVSMPRIPPTPPTLIDLGTYPHPAYCFQSLVDEEMLLPLLLKLKLGVSHRHQCHVDGKEERD